MRQCLDGTTRSHGDRVRGARDASAGRLGRDDVRRQVGRDAAGWSARPQKPWPLRPSGFAADTGVERRALPAAPEADPARRERDASILPPDARHSTSVCISSSAAATRSTPRSKRAADRFLTMEGQDFVPGDREKRLFPLAFCRECGQEYAVVDRPRHDGVPEERLEPREFDDAAPADSRDRQSGYLYLDPRRYAGVRPPSRSGFPSNGSRLGKDGFPRLQIPLPEAGAGEDRRPSGRHDWPPVLATTAIVAWFVPDPLPLLPATAASPTRRIRRTSRKLSSWRPKGAATATTVLSLVDRARAARDGRSQLRKRASCSASPTTARTPRSRPATSTTSSRSACCAAPSTGRFDDGRKRRQRRHRPARLRGAGPAVRGVTPRTRTRSLLSGGKTPKRRCATSSATASTSDLRRGWRVTAPNLEQTGLLRIALRVARRDLRPTKRSGVTSTPLSLAPRPRSAVRACKALLDFIRRELAIKVALPRSGRTGFDQARRLPEPERSVGIDEDETLATSRVGPPGYRRLQGAGLPGGHLPVGTGGFGQFLGRSRNLVQPARGGR